MRNCTLTRSPQNHASIIATVESEAIRDALQQGLLELTADLRSKLKNDQISLDIDLNKSQASVTSLTDAEAYALMRKNNPYLNTLIADLRLTMI